MARPPGHQTNGPAGPALLWMLAGASLLLLVYEVWTLAGSVLIPLLANANALQTDFHYYYGAAVRFGRDPIRLYLASDDVIAGFTYPPPAIVPFVWLSHWPLGTALLALTITSYLVLLVAFQQWMAWLRRQDHTIDRNTAAMILLIVFASGPVYMNAVFGQVNAFVLASAVAFVCLPAASAFEAGLVLALGTWLKIYPAVLAAIGIRRSETWKTIGYAMLAAMAVPIVLLPIVPLHSYSVFFFDVLPHRADKTAIHITNQSLIAFLERFRVDAGLFLNWTGQQAVTASLLTRAINWSVLIAVLALITKFARRSGAMVHVAALLMASIAVLAPLGWGHTYVMVLPLVILHIASMKQAPPVIALVVAACVAALMIPAGRHLPLDAAPDWLENIIYSRYLLATVTLILISAVSVGRSPGVGSSTSPA